MSPRPSGVSDVQCSVNDCDRPTVARSWCNAHWTRWQRHGSTMPDVPLRGSSRWPRVCSVDGCDSSHYGQGFCRAHHDRLVRNGDVAPDRPIVAKRSGCEIEGCEGEHAGLGFCDKHYQRVKTHGTVDLPPPTIYTGPDHVAWKGDEVGYAAAHFRVVGLHGSASLHLCVNCGGQAMDWAYDHRDPNELQCTDTGRKYSGDPARYLPLCRPCHKRIDNAARRGDLEAATAVMWS